MKSSLLAFTVILFFNAASLVFSARGAPKSVCTLDKDPGPCLAYYELYFFNLTSGQCEMFVYGGCQGNGNRFATLDDCENTCTCLFPAETGPCKAGIPRYHFNYDTQKCEKFTYGGCDGNPNNFETKRECYKTCKRDGLPKRCRLPKKVGPCKASIPRYYYNKDTEQCEAFTYGGCKGNRNNFKTLKQCNRVCHGDGLPKRCCLPKKVGPCKASIPRYYYNKDTEQCEAFTYGGCKGNRNNFKMLKQCNRVCHG